MYNTAFYAVLRRFCTTPLIAQYCRLPTLSRHILPIPSFLPMLSPRASSQLLLRAASRKDASHPIRPGHGPFRQLGHGPSRSRARHYKWRARGGVGGVPVAGRRRAGGRRAHARRAHARALHGAFGGLGGVCVGWGAFADGFLPSDLVFSARIRTESKCSRFDFESRAISLDSKSNREQCPSHRNWVGWKHNKSCSGRFGEGIIHPSRHPGPLFQACTVNEEWLRAFPALPKLLEGRFPSRGHIGRPQPTPAQRSRPFLV